MIVPQIKAAPSKSQVMPSLKKRMTNAKVAEEAKVQTLNEQTWLTSKPAVEESKIA